MKKRKLKLKVNETIFWIGMEMQFDIRGKTIYVPINTQDEQIIFINICQKVCEQFIDYKKITVKFKEKTFVAKFKMN